MKPGGNTVLVGVTTSPGAGGPINPAGKAVLADSEAAGVTDSTGVTTSPGAGGPIKPAGKTVL